MITTHLEQAKAALLRDDIIAIPTETVYGLAGNAYHEVAVEKIFKLKQRPFYNPLIVHISSAAALAEVAVEVPAQAKILAQAFWPGPLTMVLKKNERIPALVTGGKDTVAVRVPNHPLTLSLLAALDFPLAAPSANPFGSISPTSAAHVDAYFKDDLEVILDGGTCERGLESTIIGFEEDKAILYRLGAIAVEDIEAKIGKLGIKNKSEQAPEAPGMLLKHYSPATDMVLSEDVLGAMQAFERKKIGLLLFQQEVEAGDEVVQEVLSPSGDLAGAAKELYAAMHRLDHLGLEVIIAERFPDVGLGRTINDRLQRAVEK